ncbi:MAG: glycoside hydrolase family 16 protein [Eubacteriales bacterium]|nr:glycoside hydrolase family 16 protein [Eubacteriales bacterium]
MPSQKKYRLIWEDSFTSGQLDLTKWNYRYGNWIPQKEHIPAAKGWGNGELQYYTDWPENIRLENDRLIIQAHRRSTHLPDGDVCSYTSARIDTKGLFSFCYGKIEFRVRCSAGPGAWPAVWMMPEDSVYGDWAASGEIDLFEARGRLPKQVCGTIHYGGVTPNKTHREFTGEPGGGSDISSFHVYEVIWEEGYIAWYVDGYRYASVSAWESFTPGIPYPAPFDQNFYLIINLAIGGYFDLPAAEKIDMLRLPVTFEIDYIRVYQRPGR